MRNFTNQTLKEFKMKKMLLALLVAASFNAFASEDPAPTTTNSDCPGCELSVHHEANHTLDIYMGGFEDNLYVCKVELLGHLCEDEEGPSILAADFLTNVNGGGTLGTLSADKKVLTISQAQYEASVTSQNYTQVHLNSFRYGSKYAVTYCYDYTRITTRDLAGGNTLSFNQIAKLEGMFNLRVTDDSNYASYVGLAKPVVDFSAECDHYGDFTGYNNYVNEFPYELTGPTGSNDVEFDFEALIDLSNTTSNECRFTFTFTEPKRYPGIRPAMTNGKPAASWIKTDAMTWLDLGFGANL